MEEYQQIIEPQLDASRSAGALAPPMAVPADANGGHSELAHRPIPTAELMAARRSRTAI